MSDGWQELPEQKIFLPEPQRAKDTIGVVIEGEEVQTTVPKLGWNQEKLGLVVRWRKKNPTPAPAPAPAPVPTPTPAAPGLVQNFKVIPGDRSVKHTFDPTPGAEGYRVQFIEGG